MNTIFRARRVDSNGSEAAYIPLEFYLEFLEFLLENKNSIEIITYDDLKWGDDFDFARSYPEEKEQWHRWLGDGERNPDKAYVLIQHDLDSRPERAMTQLRHEERVGIRSNVMVFNRRVDRKRMRNTGELRFTDYPIDDDLLRRLAAKGFVIGYHSNAFEQALFDEDVAQTIFQRDVAALKERFDIRYFSAHGGTPAPDGRNNRDLPFPAALRRELRWVHNGHTPWFTATYSDGGINSPKRDPAKRDLRDFVRTWQPGGRYRVLTHPQYYDSPCGISPRLAGTPWYEEVRAHYRGKPKRSAWSDVRTAAGGGEAPAKNRLSRIARRLRGSPG